MSIPRAFITAALAALLSSAQAVSVAPPRDDAVAALVVGRVPPPPALARHPLVTRPTPSPPASRKAAPPAIGCHDLAHLRSQCNQPDGSLR